MPLKASLSLRQQAHGIPSLFTHHLMLIAQKNDKSWLKLQLLRAHDFVYHWLKLTGWSNMNFRCGPK